MTSITSFIDHARAAADVVGAPGHAARRRGDRRRHRVGHESEVARLLAVAVERDRLVPQRRLDEAVERHVGALPRAVDREVPHAASSGTP